MLTLLLHSPPALNKMMCPNQPLFQWQRTHQDQAMYLLVETTPKVGHSTNCIVLQHCFVHKCLSAFLSTTHAHYSYMFTSMQQIYLCPCLSFLQIHAQTSSWQLQPVWLHPMYLEQWTGSL